MDLNVGHKATSPCISLVVLVAVATIYRSYPSNDHRVNVRAFFQLRSRVTTNERRTTLPRKSAEGVDEDRTIVNTESGNIFTNNCPAKDAAAYANDQHVLGALD